MEGMNLIEKEWGVGFKDRGLGHGDFAVMTTNNELVVECPYKEIADHIVELHNKNREKREGE